MDTKCKTMRLPETVFGHPTGKKDFGQDFIDWLISPEDRKAIAG